MALPENRVGKASSSRTPADRQKIRSTTFRAASAASSQPCFRHAPLVAASQCSVATPQLLSPSGIGSRFPAQAVQLFSFDRNLRSIVAVGSTRLESPWLRARWRGKAGLMRCPRSAACPFDDDHANVVLEILLRGKRQTSSTKAGKSCSNARALGDGDRN